MKNEFIVENYRFHAKDRSKFLVKGCFKEDEMGENKIQFLLDDKIVPYKVEKQVDMGAALRVKVGEKIIKNKYLFWLELPDTWKKNKQFRVMNCIGEQKKEAYKISIEKLQKKANRLDKFIDGGRIEENGFKISGWCVCLHEVSIQVFDTKNTLLETQMKRRKRDDVLSQYPECDGQDIMGFVIGYKGKVPNKVRIHLDDGDRSADYEVLLKSLKAKKGVQKIKKYSIKSYAYYRQFGIRDTIKRASEKIGQRNQSSYDYWRRVHCLNKKEIEKQRNQVFPVMPKISIVVPLYKTSIPFLKKMIESVRKQSYSNWELCLSDGSGVDSPITNVLRKYETSDSRIKVVSSEKPLQISENTNNALAVATGEWIAFMDHDDVLELNALFECVKAINKDENIDMIYTDEDKITMDGKENFQPHFKSDFNIDMLCSVNYFCHLTVVKKELFDRVGELNKEYDGAQDYDFVLRCVEKAKQIKHIPKILYHWRAHKDSTAENPQSKMYAFEAGAKAIKAHYDRVGIAAEVSLTENLGIYRSKYRIKSNPLVSIIIPNKDHIDDLDKCIQSIESKATYKNVEYIVVENNSEESETFAYYEKLKNENPKVKVVEWEKEFNYSAINNYGVTFASGEYYLFLNNDTEIINEDCIEEMLGYCMRDDVGIVGAKLFYEDDTIQHSGVIVGVGGVAGHPFPGAPHNSLGYFGRTIMAQDLSAVTAACMLVKKQAYHEVGGFETKLAVAFNDIDFCLKVREKGYLVVYNPYAQLHHYESKSRGLEDTEEKIKRFQEEILTFQERWEDFLLDGDPYYNPNLTLERNDFSLA